LIVITGYDTSYWELLREECDKHCFPHHFNYYNAIEAFQDERIINALLHMRDVHVDGDGVLLHHMKNKIKRMKHKVNHIVLSWNIYVMIMFLDKIQEVFNNMINKEKPNFNSLMS
jgi:hypothetical protein